MSHTQQDNIFIQAAFHKDVWSGAAGVMNMGQLKGQKLNHKHLMSTPEFKEHSLHHLEPAVSFEEGIK